jgi:glucose/arabinose dehydrogenase
MKISHMKVENFYTKSILSIAGLLSILIVLNSCKKIDQQTNSDLQDEVNSSRSPEKKKEVDIRLITDNLVSPIGLVAIPDDDRFDRGDNHHGDNRKADDDRRLFIIDQIGKIWIIDALGNRLATPFLDLTSKIVPLSPGYDERGLLGLAFHPNYKHNGRFFVYYTAPPRAGGPQPGELWDNLSRISEFKVSSSNMNMADISSEKIILELDDPQSNHNGGTIDFGPDDYLYIAIGDGGAADDVAPGHVEDWYPVNAGGNGQDIEANLFGNILRLDIDHGMPYKIPRDNPFVGRRGKDEIYAYGFRNPFRFSFDMKGSRQLFAGDAGQVLYEEIDIVKKGGNYGWNVKEGTHCFSTADNTQELSSCPNFDNFGNRLIDPVIEVNNWQNPKGGKATTIIGGNVYRGHSIPGFEGKYIFGTFSQNFDAPNAELFIANPRGSGLWSYQEIMLKSHPNDLGQYLKGFGQDRKGEIYLATSSMLGPSGASGKIFKLVPVDKDDDED